MTEWGHPTLQAGVIGRRDLLRGTARARVALRPPGALAEPDFSARCDACGLCIKSCPEAILRPAGDGRPLVDLTTAACSFCGACTEACPTGALDAEAGEAWSWRAKVGGDCLSLNRVVCRSCGEACDSEAITFRLQTGGRALPLVDEAACTGCGACLAVCPVGAIALVDAKGRKAA